MKSNNTKKLKPIMFVGTGSDVGKSVINAAFCRILKQDGYSPAPFKAQNMSLNSYATPEGLEIGRAQAVQAEACGIDCNTDMNPVLLKPTNDKTCQVILNGKPIGNQTASEYFLQTDREILFQEALKAFERLAKNYNPVVMEGAGSISELNLWAKDITNMRIALATGASVFLVTDIDRGGIFGSVYGTILLLPEEERRHIKGVIINKFRGDIALFLDGKQILEKLTGIPVVGIIPWFKDIHIDDEDSVALHGKNKSIENASLKIAVVLLYHMSNFTDFNALERLPEVHLFYASQPNELHNADIIIIPGSKNTIADLIYLRQSGMAKAILEAHANDKSIFGICGGYQMMGESIHDPYNIEGSVSAISGLNILPVTTIISKEKVTEQQKFTFLSESPVCSGYEIHMGETTSAKSSPLCRKLDGTEDGYFLNTKTWGTYMHGIFDNEIIINNIFETHFVTGRVQQQNYSAYKEEQYDKLASLIRKNCDMEYIYSAIIPLDPI